MNSIGRIDISSIIVTRKLDDALVEIVERKPYKYLCSSGVAEVVTGKESFRDHYPFLISTKPSLSQFFQI